MPSTAFGITKQEPAWLWDAMPELSRRYLPPGIYMAPQAVSLYLKRNNFPKPRQATIQEQAEIPLRVAAEALSRWTGGLGELRDPTRYGWCWVVLESAHWGFTHELRSYVRQTVVAVTVQGGFWYHPECVPPADPEDVQEVHAGGGLAIYEYTCEKCYTEIEGVRPSIGTETS